MTQLVARRSLVDRWRGFSPFTRSLAVFALLAGIVLPLALFASTGLRVSLMHLRIVLLGKFNRDSWLVMDLARDHLAQFGDRLLYQDVLVSGHNMFMYPLTSLLVYEPIKWLPTLGFGQDLWANLVGVGFFLASVAIAAYVFLAYAAKHIDSLRGMERAEALVLFALGAFLAVRFVPLVESLDYGNIQTYLNGCFIIGFLFWLRGQKALAGVFVGLICVVKPTLAVFFVWALLRREWRFAIWFAATGAAFLVVSAAAYGLANNLDYLTAVSYVSHRGAALFSNQTVNGLLNRLLLNGPITREEAWGTGQGGFYYAPYHAFVYYATALSSAALILFALLWRRKEYARAPNIDFLLATLSFSMASPIAWTHHYGGLILAFAMGFPLALATRSIGRSWIIALIVAFVLIGERIEVPDFVARTPFNIFMSVGFFAALTLLCFLYRLRHALSSSTSVSDALPTLSLSARSARRAYA